MSDTDTWIGKVEVKPRPKNKLLGRAKGAFVNVVALASSEQDYVNLVDVTMERYGFLVVGIQDVTRLNIWTLSNTLDPELAKLARGLTLEFPIQFDEFQSYRHEEDA